MKNRLVILKTFALAAMMLGLASCQKDAVEQPQPSIIGNWKLDSTKVIVNSPILGGDQEYVSVPETAEYYKYYENGQVQRTSDGIVTDTESYIQSGDSLYFPQREEAEKRFRIEILNAQKLVLYHYVETDVEMIPMKQKTWFYLSR